jgi:hypothetical protein
MSDTKEILSAERVNAIFGDVLFKDGEDTTNHIKAEGVMQTFGFNPERLKAHEAEIAEMLDELPDQFKASAGGGWSFLNACDDKHGRQWTGMHATMEQLFALGVGTGKAQLLMPREMWEVLPGGMPYYVVR